MFHVAILAVVLAADPVDKRTEITGRVVSIADGDTCTVLAGREQVKIRLEGIDAPEKGQPFGTKARERLAELVHEKNVRVVVSGKDRYGRSLGTVWIGETNVNEMMVSEGLAWHFKRFSKDPDLDRLERDARNEKRGLWVGKNPVPPWEWRAQQKPHPK